MENKESCKNCKSFSNAGGKNKGFCLKTKTAKSAKSICPYYKPDIQIEYQQEAILPKRY